MIVTDTLCRLVKTAEILNNAGFGKEIKINGQINKYVRSIFSENKMEWKKWHVMSTKPLQENNTNEINKIALILVAKKGKVSNMKS